MSQCRYNALCKRDASMNYLGTDICDRHWEKICASKEGAEDTDMASKKKVAVKVSKKKVVKKAAAKEKGPDQRAHFGKNSGMKLGDYWPKLFEGNLKQHLSDAELAKLLKAEFPSSKQATEKMVRVHRGLYNRGQLGAQMNGGDKAVPPKTRVPEYNAEHEALPFWGERGAAKKAAKKEDRAEAVPFTKGKGSNKKRVVVRKK